MGTLKSKARKSVKVQSLPSQAANAGFNRAGGVAFEVADPALKLITMAGGSFFAEPKFYSVEDCKAVRGAGGKLDKLTQRVELADGRLKGIMETAELDDTARELLGTAVAIAHGKNPEDLMAIANWLRNEVNIRLTPQVLLILASRLSGTQALVRRYAPHIVRRPDEVKTCLLLHRYFFGHKTLKNALAQGLADAVHKFGERGLLKHEGQEFPSWKDVLCWLPRRKGWPVSDGIAKYFITGKVVDEKATPVIAARVKLGKCQTFDATARQLAKDSLVNWEVLLSQFPKDKAEVWKFLIETDQLGFMALLRNLRNILEAKIDGKHLQTVSLKLSNKDEVLKSKQLPFRFLMAYEVIKGASGVDSADANELMAAIELAANEAAYNIPELPGETVIFVDDSGSMSTPVSGKSKVTCATAARMLGAIVAKRGERVYLNAFSDDVKEVRFSKNDTVIGISNRIPNSCCGTYGHKCIEWLMQNGRKPDRVILLSDQQCYEEAGLFGGPRTMADLWARFKKTSPNTWLHSIHLNGSGDTPIDTGNRVNLVGGFSEKVVTMLLQAEGVLAKAGQAALPTVEQVREKWSVSVATAPVATGKETDEVVSPAEE